MQKIYISMSFFFFLTESLVQKIQALVMLNVHELVQESGGRTGVFMHVSVYIYMLQNINFRCQIKT